MTFIARSSADAGPEARDAARGFVGAFALACFFPYPAVAVGGRTGLQLSHALALAAAPVLAFRPPGRAFYAMLAIVAPAFLSGFVSLMRGTTPEADVIPKEAVALTLAVCVLWPGQLMDGRARFRSVLVVAAWAVLVHAAVGAYQIYAFSRDEFPLLFLFRNPSFKSMESWAELYARYVKRPCGIFPEPSAMASALGPWLVVIAGLLSDPTPGAGVGLTPGTRRLFAAAAAAGVALLAASRTGFTPTLAAAVLVACAANVPARLRSMGPGTVLSASVLAAGVCGAVGYVATTVGAGLDDRIESSWGLRGLSIATGLTANTEPVEVTFGVGPGQSTAIVRGLLAGVPRPKDQDDMAVWSLAVCHYMETGLVGAAAVGGVLAAAAWSVLRSSARALGLAALGSWVVAVALTTSYLHLSSVWLFLAAALNWDRIFPKAAGGRYR